MGLNAFDTDSFEEYAKSVETTKNVNSSETNNTVGSTENVEPTAKNDKE